MRQVSHVGYDSAKPSTGQIHHPIDYDLTYEPIISTGGHLAHSRATSKPISIRTPTISHGCQKRISSSNDRQEEITVTARQIVLSPGTPNTPRPARTKPNVASTTRMIPMIHWIAELPSPSCGSSQLRLVVVKKAPGFGSGVVLRMSDVQ